MGSQTFWDLRLTPIEHFEVGPFKFLPELQADAILCLHNLFKDLSVDERIDEHRPEHYDILGPVPRGFQCGTRNKCAIVSS